jgi:hypothetical protein
LRSIARKAAGGPAQLALCGGRPPSLGGKAVRRESLAAFSFLAQCAYISRPPSVLCLRIRSLLDLRSGLDHHVSRSCRATLGLNAPLPRSIPKEFNRPKRRLLCLRPLSEDRDRLTTLQDRLQAAILGREVFSRIGFPVSARDTIIRQLQESRAEVVIVVGVLQPMLEAGKFSFLRLAVHSHQFSSAKSVSSRCERCGMNSMRHGANWRF